MKNKTKHIDRTRRSNWDILSQVNHSNKINKRETKFDSSCLTNTFKVNFRFLFVLVVWLPELPRNINSREATSLSVCTSRSAQWFRSPLHYSTRCQSMEVGVFYRKNKRIVLLMNRFDRFLFVVRIKKMIAWKTGLWCKHSGRQLHFSSLIFWWSFSDDNGWKLGKLSN